MIEGSVNATLDTLAFDAEELLIQREVVMNISLNLLVHPGVTLSDIAHVRSYLVAYAQCRVTSPTNSATRRSRPPTRRPMPHASWPRAGAATPQRSRRSGR